MPWSIPFSCARGRRARPGPAARRQVRPAGRPSRSRCGTAGAAGGAASPRGRGDRLVRGRDDGLGGEAELAVERLGVGRGAVVLERDATGRRRRRACATTARCRPRPRPGRAPTAGSTDSRYAASCSSNHSRHGTETTRVAMPGGLERLARRDGELHLGAGADEDHVGRAGRSPRAARRRRGRRRRRWRSPSSPRGNVGTFCRVRMRPTGPVGALEDRAPRRGGLVGVGRADDVEAGDRAQRGEVLDRLVGRAVLAEADRVVRPDVGRPATPMSAASRTAPRM